MIPGVVIQINMQPGASNGLRVPRMDGMGRLGRDGMMDAG